MQFASIKHGDLREARQVVWILSRRGIIKCWRVIPIKSILLPALIWLDADFTIGRTRGVATLLIGYGIVSFLWALLIPLYAIERAARKVAAETSPSTVTITDESYTFDEPGLVASRHWSVVASAEERRGKILLRNAAGGAVGLLCGQCAGPQNFAELRMFLVGRGVLPQAYKIKI